MGKMHWVRVCAGIWILLFLAAIGRADHSSGIAEPMDAIRDSVNAVLSLLNDERLAAPEMKGERRRRIMKIIDDRFDFTETSRRTLSSRWNTLSPADREAFVVKFSKLLKNFYVGKLDAYAGGKVVFEKQLRKEARAAVLTHFEQNGEKVTIIYRLLRSKARWKAYDMVIEGVSVVKNYRNQFHTVIENEQFAGLMKRLDEKNDRTVLP